jgi:hypothetical protein
VRNRTSSEKSGFFPHDDSKAEDVTHILGFAFLAALLKVLVFLGPCRKPLTFALGGCTIG